MKIGFVGAGKLGLPVAVTCDLCSHDVMCYDVDPTVKNEIRTKQQYRYKEAGPAGTASFDQYLAKSKIRYGTLREVADHSEIIFVAVQTPHDSEYEGITPLPERRRDFDYLYLINAIKSLSKVIRKDTVVAIISTVLPGTIRREILPLCSPHMKICYNPFFIAMGTVMQDFLYPEFVLLGADDRFAAARMRSFYSSNTRIAILQTTVENAEVIKVLYNTFISMKIVFANTAMEVCHKIPNTDVDVVSHALSQATDRLISPRYLRGGMGDGGACHPRDNIALSWLAVILDLSYDWFENIMVAREKQTRWLASLMVGYSWSHGLPMCILGTAFKADSNITTGSSALLLKNLLEREGYSVVTWDSIVDTEESVKPESWQVPHVFLVGINHTLFKNMRFPPGSVVIDPWRWVTPQQPDVTYVPVGIGPKL